jgi:bifunctional oligoribonuclease and PAP phosphatase NrnA
MTYTHVPENLLAFFRDNRRFLIVGHKEPDGDCIGSQLALSHFLSRIGKESFLYSDGPFARTELRPYEDYFRRNIDVSIASPGTVWVIIDCSTRQRIGAFESKIGGLPVAIIDHHDSGSASGDVVFLEPTAPASTLLVQSIIETMVGSVDQAEAEYLLFGLCTDTGFFRHLNEGSGPAFEAAGRLADAGASPKRTHQLIYGGKSLNSRLLMGTILARSESYFGGRLLLSTETLEDSVKFGLESRDSDMLYQLLLSVEGCEAIAMIRQESENNCTVGLRSRSAVDVGAIAAAFGGGGHKQAAGIYVEGKIDGIKRRLLDGFSRVM